MATQQVPGPEDGDRPDGPMPTEETDRENQADEPGAPVRPIVDHPEEQNSG